jgi:RimJ/RimL family protein N-acetyltransferase
MSQKIIETERLIIRPFVMDDLLVIHRILDQTLGDGSKVNNEAAIMERRSWLEWSILSQEWLPTMGQFPYGDRAITLKSKQIVIGAAGYVPLLDVYDQIAELRSDVAPSKYRVPEVGLFWAIDQSYQRQGYASEAAQGLIEYAFKRLRLKRILATTEYENIASQAVMQKVGMKLTHNPLPTPPWLQVVGVIENSSSETKTVA